MQTVKIPMPVAGIDKLSNETSLQNNTWRTAMNVDIDRSGQAAVRDGFTRVLTGADYHSTWYAVQRSWLLAGKGSTLVRVDPLTATETTLINVGSASPFSYTEYNGNLYVVCSTGLYYVPSSSSSVRRCGAPQPAAPSATPSANGGLAPGKYAVSISLTDDLWEESPTSSEVFVDLPTGGGIQLSSLPIVAGYRVNIYVTPANGDILYHYASPPASFATHLVSANPSGAQSTTQFLTPFRGGRFVRWHNGRLYVVNGDTLSYSDAFRPHLTRTDTNFVQFSGNISFVEPVAGGIFVGDERGVWFLEGGDPTKFSQRRVSTCRAVPGTSLVVPNEHFDQKVVNTTLPVAVWLCTSGYAVGTAEGAIFEVNADIIRVPLATRGSSAFAIRNGRKQVLTVTNSAEDAYGMAIDTVITTDPVERREDGNVELRENGSFEFEE